MSCRSRVTLDSASFSQRRPLASSHDGSTSSWWAAFFHACVDAHASLYRIPASCWISSPSDRYWAGARQVQQLCGRVDREVVHGSAVDDTELQHADQVQDHGGQIRRAVRRRRGVLEGGKQVLSSWPGFASPPPSPNPSS